MNFTKLLILCILAIAVCSTLAGPAKNRRRNNRGQRGNGNAGGANAGNANANDAESDAENDSEDGTDLKGWKKKAVSGFVYLPLFFLLLFLPIFVYYVHLRIISMFG